MAKEILVGRRMPNTHSLYKAKVEVFLFFDITAYKAAGQIPTPTTALPLHVRSIVEAVTVLADALNDGSAAYVQRVVNWPNSMSKAELSAHVKTIVHPNNEVDYQVKYEKRYGSTDPDSLVGIFIDL